MAHEAVGRLRGKSAPADAVLDRLIALCPTWRVHWVPDWEGGWSWVLGNRIASKVYRDTGRYIYDRYVQWSKENGKPAPLAAIAGAETMMDGDYLVRRFTDEQFGGDWMFAELGAVAERFATMDQEERDKLTLQRRKLEWQQAKTEALKNRAFAEYVDALKAVDPSWFEDSEAIWKDSQGFYLRGQRSFSAAGRPTEVTL